MKKKTTAILLAATMVLSSLGAGSASLVASADKNSGMTYEEWMEQDPAIIGVCFSQINDEYNGYKTFLEEYVAPQYNLQFVFSEQVEDIAGEISFLESCSAQGAVGFITFCNNDVEQIADRCEGLGIYLTQNAILTEDQLYILSYEYYLGAAYADTDMIGEQYANGLNEIMEGEELEGLILTTAVAARGNAQHISTGVSILDAVAAIADLTYDEEEYDLVTSSSAINVGNSADLPIYIYPGTVANTDGYLAGLSSQLMTGQYNVVVSSTTSYSQMMTVIDEAETALDKDIKLISVAAVGTDLETAMTTTDSFGNLTLDAAVIKPGTWVIGGLVIPILNALTGYENAYKDENGDSALYVAGSFLTTTTEEMQEINTKDDPDDADSWVMQISNMEEMLGMYNTDITVDDVTDYFSQDLDNLFS